MGVVVALTFLGHPFASYCQKALIALYENGIDFSYREIDLGNPESAAELERLWPFRQFPVLQDGVNVVVEATIIIEYLDLHYPGQVRLLPGEPKAALEVRFLDRFFDNYVHAPMQAIVSNALRGGSAGDWDATGARQTLDTAYRWLEAYLAGRQWAALDRFTLADCAAAPALFYTDWVHPIGEEFPNIRAFRNRLNARPSFARCIEEGRPFRPFFPLGAPNRD